MVCFQAKNPNFGKIWRTLEWKMFFIFYDHLEYFMVIWYNSWPFGIHSLWSFGIFLRFGMFGPRKIWQP
jgi:hypothetical protein